MSYEAWFSTALSALLVFALALTNWPADMVFVGVLTLLALPFFHDEKGWHGVLSASEVFDGLGNSSVVTIGVLFVVVAGLRDTGGLISIVERLLGRPKGEREAQIRMMVPVATASAFMNNTPLVAIMIPIIKEWGQKYRISPSKLLMPLSFATILGGVGTLIGTSTNLTVHGLMQKMTPDLYPLGFFEIGKVGLPCAVVGILYLWLFFSKIVPDRTTALQALSDPREYTIEMMVEPGSPMVGRTVEQAGLRHLSGAYLVEIQRDDDEVIQAVGPMERLRSRDRLIFVGIVESVKDLQRIRGLVPATDQVFKLDSPRTQRRLVEAVVSDTSPIVGRSIREGRFRSIYDAAVIAVSRNGERINSKIGDIVLRTGDTLLLEAHPSFVERMANRRDFFLVSQVADSAPVRHDRAWVSVLILLGMVTAATFQWVDVLVAAMTAAGLMLVTRCTSVASARSSIDWSILVVIAASLGLSAALDKTGAADSIAQSLIQFAGGNEWMTLFWIYVITTVFTEVMSNNAAAVLAMTIAVDTAKQLHDASPMPFIAAIMIGASCSFATPIGYQTNMMVYGPGGYRFMDFVRVGLPMNVLMGMVTVSLAPLIWPFHR
jgi:di/tricarboxylate transporter